MASRIRHTPVSLKTCPVCNENIRDVQTLSCQHHICTNCFQQLLSASATANSLHCPSCGMVCTLPGRSHRVTKKTASSGPPTADAKHTVYCSNEGDGPATVFCRDCEEFHCQDCASSHQRLKITRGHKLIPVDKMSPEELKEAQSPGGQKTCTEHKQPFTILCKTCKELTCAICALFKHKDHSLQEIDDAAKQAQKKLTDIIEETVEYITKQESLLDEITKTKRKIGTDVTKAKKMVKETAQEWHDIIKNHETDLLRDLDRHEAEILTKLESVKQRAEFSRAGALYIREKCHKLCHSGIAIDQVELTPTLQQHFDARNKSHQLNVNWEFTFEYNKKQTRKSIKTTLGDVRLNLFPKMISNEHVRSVSLLYDRATTGMVVIGNCLCVTHYGDPHLWLYDMVKGSNKKCLVPGLSNPGSMVTVNSHIVVLADGKLHFLRISADLQINPIKVKVIPRLKSPFSISVSTETRELFILTNNGKQSQFVVCDLEGDIQRRVTVRFGDCWPRLITRAKHGYVALVGDGEYCDTVELLDMDGNSTDSYYYGGEKGRRTWNDYQMVTDSTGRIIVADWDRHRLFSLDTDGRLAESFCTENNTLSKPEQVYLNETSARFYVSHELDGNRREVRSYRWYPKSRKDHFTNIRLHLNVMSPESVFDDTGNVPTCASNRIIMV